MALESSTIKCLRICISFLDKLWINLLDRSYVLNEKNYLFPWQWFGSPSNSYKIRALSSLSFLDTLWIQDKFFFSFAFKWSVNSYLIRISLSYFSIIFGLFDFFNVNIADRWFLSNFLTVWMFLTYPILLYLSNKRGRHCILSPYGNWGSSYSRTTPNFEVKLCWAI